MRTPSWTRRTSLRSLVGGRRPLERGGGDGTSRRQRFPMPAMSSPPCGSRVAQAAPGGWARRQLPLPPLVRVDRGHREHPRTRLVPGTPRACRGDSAWVRIPRSPLLQESEHLLWSGHKLRVTPKRGDRVRFEPGPPEAVDPLPWASRRCSAFPSGLEGRCAHLWLASVEIGRVVGGRRSH